MSDIHLSGQAPHGGSHGTLRTCVTGFLLSLLLTVLSFGLVMSGRLPPGTALMGITALAVLQLIVQLGFFLHLGTAPEQRSNTVIFVLTSLLIATVVIGSLWVMHNADVNMMPQEMAAPGS